MRCGLYVRFSRELSVGGRFGKAGTKFRIYILDSGINITFRHKLGGALYQARTQYRVFQYT